MNSNSYGSILSFPDKTNGLRFSDIRLKTIEVCLASLCLGLGLDAFMNGAVPQWPGVGLCCILTGAYVIITGVAIGCSLFANPLPKSLSVTLSAVGGLLFAATAANVLRGWEAAAAAGGPGAATVRYATGLRQMRAQGLLALGAAAAFLMDAAHEGVVGPWLQCEPGSSPGARASLALPLPPASRAVSGTGLSRAPSGHLPLQARGSVFRDLSAATAGAGAAPFARPVPPVSAASFATSFGRAVSAVSQRLPPVSAAAAAARRFHRGNATPLLSELSGVVPCNRDEVLSAVSRAGAGAAHAPKVRKRSTTALGKVPAGYPFSAWGRPRSGRRRWATSLACDHPAGDCQ